MSGPVHTPCPEQPDGLTLPVDAASDLPRILFFSRGRGHGHVLRDHEIAQRLTRSSLAQVQLVSYGTGAMGLRERAVPVHDLELPDNNPFVDTIVRATRLTTRIHPDLIVAHEEFAALVAAASVGVPSLFLTDWFLDPEHLFTKTLTLADEILFLETSGIFTEPPALRGRVTYLGPMIRELRYAAHERPRARHELGIDSDALVVSCLPGTTDEASTPILTLVLAAFDLLTSRNKLLVWVDRANYAHVHAATANRPDVRVMRHERIVERIMVASDVVITKGTRNTLRELHCLGIPSISLTHGKNWIDDVLANRLPGNTPWRAGEITANKLAEAIETSVGRICGPAAAHANSAEAVCARIAAHIKPAPLRNDDD